MKGWVACLNWHGEPHVYPQNDLHPHDIGDASSCRCDPTLFDGTVVHHAWDRREMDEPDVITKLLRIN